MQEQVPESSQTLVLPPRIARTLPAIVRDELTAMAAVKQEAFLEEYRRRRKRVLVAYLAWLIFSHYAYLGGRWLVQFVFWLTSGGFFVWWLFDGFRLFWMVQNFNRDVAIEVLRDVRAISER